MKTKTENGKLVLFLEGRLDSTSAAEAQAEIDALLSAHPDPDLILDAGALSYISSAGLRVLLHLRQRLDRPLPLREVSPEIYDILNITGFTALLDVKRRLRELSVAGCPVIGRGAIGTVYRLDADTIVKVYEIPDSLHMIENEQRLAKQAFLNGIPTAISYDVVRVGDKYGSVFELIKAQTCNDRLLTEPEQAEDIIRQYTDLIRRVHALELDRDQVPDARQVYGKYLEAVVPLLPAPLAEHLRALLSSMPEDRHAVHGDIHMKNVMISDGEPLLIDMDTLCAGNQVFDLAALFVSYYAYLEDELDNSLRFFGISRELSEHIYRQVLETSLDALDEAARQAAEDAIEILGRVRFLYLVAVLGITLPELRDIRVQHSIARLEALTARVDHLDIRLPESS